MFNLARSTKLRGIGYKALNVLRPCNIIALLTVAVASWIMVVMTGIKGQFFFFDAMAHVFSSSIALFLIFTEVQLGPLKSYFERTWPVFADCHGFLWLGLAMSALGCDMLGNLNKPAFTAENLGLPMWRMILASGVLSLTFGIFNFVATLIFRDKHAGLTARMIRADGNLADGGKLGLGVSSAGAYYASSSLSSRSTTRYNKETYAPSFSAHAPAAAAAAVDDDMTTGPPTMSRFRRMTQVFMSPFGHGNAADAGAGTASKKMVISKPIPINGGRRDGGDVYAHVNDEERAVENDGSNYGEDRSSPILPSIRRPPTAMHPAMHPHYSVADMERF